MSNVFEVAEDVKKQQKGGQIEELKERNSDMREFIDSNQKPQPTGEDFRNVTDLNVKKEQEENEEKGEVNAVKEVYEWA